jgi:hypothetical protein
MKHHLSPLLHSPNLITPHLKDIVVVVVDALAVVDVVEDATLIFSVKFVPSLVILHSLAGIGSINTTRLRLHLHMLMEIPMLLLHLLIPMAITMVILLLTLGIVLSLNQDLRHKCL